MINQKNLLEKKHQSCEQIAIAKTICIHPEMSIPQPIGFYPQDQINVFNRGLFLYKTLLDRKKKQSILPWTKLTLFSLKDAFFVVFPGLDGMIITSDSQIVGEPSCFINKNQLPHLLQHTEIKAPLENVFIGFDAACSNYYHWLLYAISKTQLANKILSDNTILALPSERSLFENRYCSYNQLTYTQTLQYSQLNKRVTFFDYGIYPVKNLQFFWHKTSMPEIYLTFEEIYDLFNQIHGVDNPSLPKIFYISREQHSNPRINANEQQIIDYVLKQKSIQKVYLEQMDFPTQVSLFRQADLVISPHGAGLANMVFANKNTALLELNRKLDRQEHLRNCFYLITAMKKQRYSCINLSNTELKADIFSNMIDQLLF